VAGSIGSENVALMEAPRETPVALAVGVVESTVGESVSVTKVLNAKSMGTLLPMRTSHWPVEGLIHMASPPAYGFVRAAFQL
jgi:hypothetical protein